MLVSIGEILVDIFKDEKGETVYPGGAPFNLASNATNYTKEVYFVGSVGNDKNGQLLIETAKKVGFVKDGIKIIPNRETSRAVVTLDNGDKISNLKLNIGPKESSLDDAYRNVQAKIDEIKRLLEKLA